MGLDVCDDGLVGEAVFAALSLGRGATGRNTDVFTLGQYVEQKERRL